ncbi:MAG: hypothetical protein R3236_03560 [Phycisphaeraceae bacterium]|nr:hypothetical protein [Phycisphaeraceae bacterium]
MNGGATPTPTDSLKPTDGWLPVRLFAYTVVLFVGMAMLGELGQRRGLYFFLEKNGLENFQLALALAVTVGLAVTAWRKPPVRQGFIYMALLAALAVTREIDFILDVLLPGLSWKLTVAILFTVANANALWRWRRFWPQISHLSGTGGGAMIWAGFVVVVALAQWLGHQDLWRPIMEEAYSRQFKRVMEEIVETFGYLLIFFGTIEAMIRARRIDPAPTASENGSKPLQNDV